MSPSRLLVGFEIPTIDHTSQSYDSNINTKESQHLYLKLGETATVINNNAYSQYHGNTTTIKLISQEEMFNRGAFIIPRALCSSDSSNMVPFAAVECNGPFVPCCFYPLDSTYNVISTGGLIFNDIELEGDGNWSDYDYIVGEPAALAGLKGVFFPYKECTSLPLCCFNSCLLTRGKNQFIYSPLTPFLDVIEIICRRT